MKKPQLSELILEHWALATPAEQLSLCRLFINLLEYRDPVWAEDLRKRLLGRPHRGKGNAHRLAVSAKQRCDGKR
jgi:hypothetical protein